MTDLAKIGETNNDRTKGMQGMVYQYDQLHRITSSKSLINYIAGGPGHGASGFPIRPTNSVYDEKYSYDPNGNITTLKRNDELATLKDDFAYSYYDTTNRLMQHKVSGGLYYYDAIGNLVKDENEGVIITWTPYGKVRTVHKGDSITVSYRYDASGNRVEKKVVNDSRTTITKYLRDASGNVMTIYKDTLVSEVPIYGSARVGEYKGGVVEGERTLGRKNYELSNHLGNVLVVITDNTGMVQDSVWATVVSTNDYYPFGLEMKGRSWSDTTSSYRYGFNGKEKDSAFASTTSYDYGFRIYSPGIAKFLSVDPLTSQYAELTPYQFASNKPINSIDIDGLEARTSIKGEFINGRWTMGSDNYISLKHEVELKMQAEQAMKKRIIVPDHGTLRNNDITSTPQYKMFEFNVNTYGDFVLPLDISKRLIKGEEVHAWEIGVEAAGFIPFGKILGKGSKALIAGAIKVWKNGDEVLEAAYKFGNLGYKGTKPYREAVEAVKKGGNFVASSKEEALDILNSSFKNIPDETGKEAASGFGYRIDEVVETVKDGLKQGHQGTHINYYDKKNNIKGAIIIEEASKKQ